MSEKSIKWNESQERGFNIIIHTIISLSLLVISILVLISFWWPIYICQFNSILTYYLMQIITKNEINFTVLWTAIVFVSNALGEKSFISGLIAWLITIIHFVVILALLLAGYVIIGIVVLIFTVLFAYFSRVNGW